MKFFYSSFLFFLLIYCTKKDSEQEKTVGDYYYKKAEIYYSQKKYSNSFVFFNSAFQDFLITNHKEKASQALAYQAIIQTIEGDYFGSEKTATDALKILQKAKISNDGLLVSIYNQIALNKEYQKDFTASTYWYKLAKEKNKDPYNSLVILNNIAVTFYEQKKYHNAIEILEKIYSKKIDSLEFKARIIDNLSYAKYLQYKNYNAEKELYRALEIREKEKDFWGQNASHAHLSDYFVDKNPEKSLFHAQKMYEIAKNLKSPDDQLEALQKLVKLDSKNYQKHFSRFQSINDSLQIARNKAKNQFALIKYETEKEKAENAKKQNQILRQYFGLAILAIALITFFFWYKKRKKRLEQEKEILKQEKEIEIKNTQLKYSKKVHDVVANGLYQTMVEIENQPELNKEKVLNHIEKLYEESRDIAQDDFTEISDKEFSIRLSQMISSYNSESQKIFIAGNEHKLWENISPNIQSELYYVIRELLVNMKKHSHAKLISLKFEKNEDILKIKYVDNGIGINDLEIKTGSGIKNTENRIASIGGEINFEKNPQKRINC